jgi:Tat protein secretion system quality control protein TatD with DNase activity
MLVDSHCHLDFPELSARINQVLDLMQGQWRGLRRLYCRHP